MHFKILGKLFVARNHSSATSLLFCTVCLFVYFTRGFFRFLFLFIPFIFIRFFTTKLIHRHAVDITPLGSHKTLNMFDEDVELGTGPSSSYSGGKQVSFQIIDLTP